MMVAQIGFQKSDARVKVRCWGATEHYAELGIMFRCCSTPMLVGLIGAGLFLVTIL
jgi:hypothetical protein